MKYVLIFNLFLLSFASLAKDIQVPKELEIKKTYIMMGNEIARMENKLELRSIPIDHLDGLHVLYKGDPELLFLSTRMSQIESLINMIGVEKAPQRQIANLKKLSSIDILKNRIQRAKQTLKGI